MMTGSSDYLVSVKSDNTVSGPSVRDGFLMNWTCLCYQNEHTVWRSITLETMDDCSKYPHHSGQITELSLCLSSFCLSLQCPKETDSLVAENISMVNVVSYSTIVSDLKSRPWHVDFIGLSVSSLPGSDWSSSPLRPIQETEEGQRPSGHPPKKGASSPQKYHAGPGDHMYVRWSHSNVWLVERRSHTAEGENRFVQLAFFTDWSHTQQLVFQKGELRRKNIICLLN